MYFGQAVGLLIMTLLLAVFPALLLKPLNASLNTWLLGIAAALLTVSGSLALSKALRIGQSRHRRAGGDVLQRRHHPTVLGQR